MQTIFHFIIDSSILRLFQEVEFEIDEVRFDEVEGAFEIERQSVVYMTSEIFK
jgi:hypothetical protein